jgi:hypothetical protein
MSAHLRPLQVFCEVGGCKSRAVVEAFNTYNAASGKFCRRHGEQRVKELQAGEKLMRDAQEPTR